jgi:FkbM family methyltransferase
MMAVLPSCRKALADSKGVMTFIWTNPGNRGQRLRRTLRGIGWQVAKRLANKTRPLVLANGAHMQVHPDCVVSSALIYTDWPEYHELAFIRERLRSTDVVIDVGANVGHILLLVSDIVEPGHLFAFEPTPVSFLRLKANWELNGWCTNRLFHLAIGSAPGTAFIPNTARPDTTNAVRLTKSNGDIEVQVRTLDELHELWRDMRIGLLKIDVEGDEAEVFGGGVELLRSQRPRLVMFESLGRCVEPRIARLLNDAGYRIFQLDECGRPDSTRVSAQNLFAMPTEELTERAGFFS